MNRLWALLVLFAAACTGLQPTVAPTFAVPTRTFTPAPSSTAAPTLTATPAPTSTRPPTRTAAPTRTATVTPTFTPTATPPDPRAKETELDALMEDILRDLPAPGAVVGIRLGGGAPPLIKAYGFADPARQVPMQPDSILQVGSITKQFTAAALLQLAEEGLLDLDDPVTRFFPGLPPHAGRVTIRSLLNHTSGLADSFSPRFTGYPPGGSPPPENGIYHLEEDFPPAQAEPGAAWVYNNTGYVILGLVIEQASGETFGGYLQNHMFGPLGLDDTSHCIEPVEGEAVGHALASGFVPVRGDMRANFAAGGLCSTAADLLEWQQALASGRVISPASYAEMLSPARLNDGSIHPYGLGMAASGSGETLSAGHAGFAAGSRSYLGFTASPNMTVVLLYNVDTGNPEMLVWERLFPLFR